VGLTALPDKCVFFTARGSVLGDVPAEVVAAAFAVFSLDEIIPLVRRGQALADAATVWAARVDGAAAQLRRILGPAPDRVGWVAERLLAAAEDLPIAGRALFAAQRAAAVPDDPIARLWRAADRLSEFRGDSHIQVWSVAGFDRLEIGLLSDLFWDLAPRAHTAGRGWTIEQMAAGEDRLRARGLLDSEGLLTEQGRVVREDIEDRTDAALDPALAVLGDDIDEILSTLEPWGRAIRDAGGYLTPLVRLPSAPDADPRPSWSGGVRVFGPRYAGAVRCEGPVPADPELRPPNGQRADWVATRSSFSSVVISAILGTTGNRTCERMASGTACQSKPLQSQYRVTSVSPAPAGASS
jgi:hypothetical protein